MSLPAVQNHAGAAGTGVALSAGFASTLVTLTPMLQAISLIVSIFAGLLSVVWYIHKFWNRK